jgi:hypothetical protein
MIGVVRTLVKCIWIKGLNLCSLETLRVPEPAPEKRPEEDWGSKSAACATRDFCLSYLITCCSDVTAVMLCTKWLVI